MNFIVRLFSAMMALVAIVACEKEPAEVVPSQIEVEATELGFDDRGETKSLGYTIKNAIDGETLSATTEAEWLTIAVEADKKQSVILDQLPPMSFRIYRVKK